MEAWTLLLRDEQRGLVLPLPVVSLRRLSFGTGRWDVVCNRTSTRRGQSSCWRHRGREPCVANHATTIAALHHSTMMQAYATRPIKPGEELVSVGLREQEQAALLKVERRRAANRAKRRIARALQAAEHQSDLLKLSMLQLLVQSGWRQHHLDVIARRHYALAAQQLKELRKAAAAAKAASEAAAAAGESAAADTRSLVAEWYSLRADLLDRAMRCAALRYSGSGGRSTSTPAFRRRLQDALEPACRRIRPLAAASSCAAW